MMLIKKAAVFFLMIVLMAGTAVHAEDAKAALAQEGTKAASDVGAPKAAAAAPDAKVPATGGGAEATPPQGEAARPTTDLSVSVLSAYISKGDELSRNSIVIQPQVVLGYKGLSLTLWGNLDTRPYLAETSTYKGDKRQNWTETDVTVAYNRAFGLVNTGIAYAYFGNAGFWNSDGGGAGPDQKDDQEVSVSVGLNTLLSPNLKVGRSFDSTQIWYFLLGLSHSFEFNKIVSLNLAASASYLISQDDNRLKVNSDGSTTKADGSRNDRFNNFHDAVLSLSLPVKATTWLTVSPQLAYIFPMCDDAKYDMKYRSMQIDTAFGDRQNAYLVGGVSATISF